MGASCTKCLGSYFSSGSAADTTAYQAVGAAQPPDVAMKEMNSSAAASGGGGPDAHATDDDDAFDEDFGNWEESEAEAEKEREKAKDSSHHTSIAIDPSIAPLPAAANPASSPVVPRLEKPPAAAPSTSSYAAAVALAQQSQESLFGDMAVNSYVEQPRVAPKAKPAASVAKAAEPVAPVRATGKFDVDSLMSQENAVDVGGWGDEGPLSGRGKSSPPADTSLTNPYDADLGLDLAELGILDESEQGANASTTSSAPPAASSKKPAGNASAKDKKAKGLGAVAVATALSDEPDPDLDSMLDDLGI